MTIDKSALLAALQPTTVVVPVDGFGPLTLRQLTVAQTDAARARAKDSDQDFGLFLLLVAVVDDAGAPVFDDADLATLRNSSGTKVDGLVAKVLEINGYTGKAQAPGN